MLPRLLPVLALSLALLWPVRAALPAPSETACPAGQQPVCLLVCICVPSGAVPGGAYESLEQLAASALQRWIAESYQAIDPQRLQPIPLHIRARLEPWFAAELLERVRYVVGEDTLFGTAHTVMQNPDVEAITLIDRVVFRLPSDAEDNTGLWAHELHHVEQYLQWGVAGFARRYTRNYRDVEEPAYARQRHIEQALRATPEAALR